MSPHPSLYMYNVRVYMYMYYNVYTRTYVQYTTVHVLFITEYDIVHIQ